MNSVPPRRGPSMARLFVVSVAVGAAAVFGLAAWSSHESAVARAAAAEAAKPRALAALVDVSTQLAADALPSLPRAYAMVVDLRPDGEEADQPSSTVMADAAKARSLSFRYVPVPHGDIPASAVAQLRAALADAHGPVLLYCRSGRRAARTWALAEAARPDGPGAEQIIASVRAAGQDASDLRARIDASIAARGSAQ